MNAPTLARDGAIGAAPAGLLNYAALDLGGMPAYRQALRALEAGYLELSDRLAQHLAEHDAELRRAVLAAAAEQRMLTDMILSAEANGMQVYEAPVGAFPAEDA